MISTGEFYSISNVVEKAIDQMFYFAKKNSNPSDFLLFLAGADTNDTISQNEKPYVYDYHVDDLNMDSRIQFLEMYLNGNYAQNSFPTKDTPVSLTFELLLYMQIWGEKSFLKKLHRLAALCNKEKYVWSATIPERDMPKFIKKFIDKFKRNGLDIAEILNNTYLSQIRNAAAHDEYRLSNDNNIVFLNYKKKKKKKQKQIQSETFNDWTKRFATTFLLEYHLFNEFMHQRDKIPCNFPFPCTLKDKFENDRPGVISYNGKRFTIQ